MARISKLLIANRGEIVSRVARTARSMGMATVAVYSDPDRDAPFVRDCDEAVHLPGTSPGDTYLRSDLIVAAALRSGAEAVHPGYGFLSENADFARRCAEAGLIFVGPPPEAIEAMASKIEAKRIMSLAGVPVLPGFVVEPGAGEADLLEKAEAIGYPLLVKAAFGGGGRGMRTVWLPGELAAAVGEAQREAASAFGDGTVFVERYLPAPRHVEVQVFADAHGQVVHLFERECSIQRRHQKVIEEAPSPAVVPGLRERLGATAVAAARAIGYVGAGTVEFVMEPDGSYHFLEVNTRLQVEHPVTEAITGLDLVQVQLLVASGAPLPQECLSPRMNGHAVEARLYAEDVAAGFLPVSGRLSRFRIPAGEGVRVDAGYEDGSVVSTFYDAMLAKVIAWAPTRDEAADRLAGALERASLHGVATNRELLVRVLRSDDFRSGRTDTAFFERHEPALLGRPLYHPEAARLHPCAAAVHLMLTSAAQGPLPPAIPPGWRNVGGGTAPLRFRLDGEVVEVPGRLQEILGVSLVSAEGESVTLEAEGVRRTYRVTRDGPRWYVESALGSTVLEEVERFPAPRTAISEGSLTAPMPGTVTSVRVEVGQVVDAGEVVLSLEAMKMEHAVRSPRRGRVAELRVKAGDQVDNGAVLVVLDGAGEDLERLEERQGV